MSNNIEWSVKGTKLTVTMDIGAAALAKAKPSKTGKTNLVASSEGSMKINDDGLSLQINLMQKTT